MTRKKGFEIDHRVAIAMDALPAIQKVNLGRLLHDKDRFVKYASVQGRSQKISSAKPLYELKVGSSGLRLIYSIVDGNISVLDIMHKANMDRFASKEKDKGDSPKKAAGHAPVKKDEKIKAHKS